MIMNKTSDESLEFPPRHFNSYRRLLAYRIGQRFRLNHATINDVRTIIIIIFILFSSLFFQPNTNTNNNNNNSILIIIIITYFNLKIAFQ